MLANNLYLPFVVILFVTLTSTETIRFKLNNTSINSNVNDLTGVNGNISVVNTSVKNRLVQGKEIIHDTFANMDRGTIIRATIVLGGIIGLILLYVGIKAFLLREKRQPKRYTLITDPSSMEEPLFGSHDNDEEIEDDTLFARK